MYLLGAASPLAFVTTIVEYFDYEETYYGEETYFDRKELKEGHLTNAKGDAAPRRILTTLAVGCYNEYGENVAKLYMSPHAPKSGLVTCMMEAALDPNTRTIRKMRMSGDMSKRNETRLLSVFYDRNSGTLQAKYTCQEEICNSVGAFMDALRKGAEKERKESILLKFMLLGMEKELRAASKRYDPEIIFVVCAGITSAFAFFALLHMLTGLLLSKLKS